VTKKLLVLAITSLAAVLIGTAITPVYAPIGDIDVPLDIKPESCPNPLNVNSEGVLPVAILGTADIDVTTIDLSTITLQGVSPLRSGLEDVATPFEPFIGKTDALDCTDEGPDGFVDLTFKFSTQAIVAAWDEPSDGEVIVLRLEGNFNDGQPFEGEDVVIIISKN